MAGRKYLWVAAELRDRIQRGDFRPGDRLPSLTGLQREFDVSDSVILGARRVLMAEGLIYTRPGAGTYVSETPARRQLRRSPGSSREASPFHSGSAPVWEAESESVTATPDIAQRLQIQAGDRVMRTRYVNLHGPDVVQVVMSFEPYAVVGRTPAILPEEGPLAGLGLVERMRAIGVRVTRVAECVSSRPATDAEAEILAVPSATPVTVVERTHMAEDRPVETADIVVLAGRYAFSYGFDIG